MEYTIKADDKEIKKTYSGDIEQVAKKAWRELKPKSKTMFITQGDDEYVIDLTEWLKTKSGKKGHRK